MSALQFVDQQLDVPTTSVNERLAFVWTSAVVSHIVSFFQSDAAPRTFSPKITFSDDSVHLSLSQNPPGTSACVLL